MLSSWISPKPSTSTCATCVFPLWCIIYEKGRRGLAPSASSLHPKHHLCSFLGNPGGRQQALKQRPALRIDFSFLNFVLLFLLLMMMIMMMMMMMMMMLLLLLLVIWTSHQTLQTRLHLRKTEKGDPFHASKKY